MNRILVSIIIPCYNVEDYISECLESALAQTYRPIEIIAVDNNSTDGTIAILKDYESRYPALITVLEEKKQGAPAARNKGMSVAKGEWLQFLDADCILFSNKINYQVNLLLTANNDSVMVVSASYIKLLSGAMKVLPLDNGDEPFKSVLFNFLGCTYSNLYYKTVVRQVGCWDESLFGAQDPDLIFKILEFCGRNKLIYDQTIQSMSKQRVSGQITTSNPLRFNISALKVRINMCVKIESSMPTYYKENIFFFKDAIFHFIARLAAIDVKLAKQYYDKHIGSSYKLKYRRGIISVQQSFGVNYIGFANYFYARKCVRILIKTVFPNIEVKRILILNSN